MAVQRRVMIWYYRKNSIWICSRGVEILQRKILPRALTLGGCTPIGGAVTMGGRKERSAARRPLGGVPQPDLQFLFLESSCFLGFFMLSCRKFLERSVPFQVLGASFSTSAEGHPLSWASSNSWARRSRLAQLYKMQILYNWGKLFKKIKRSLFYVIVYWYR